MNELARLFFKNVEIFPRQKTIDTILVVFEQLTTLTFTYFFGLCSKTFIT